MFDLSDDTSRSVRNMAICGFQANRTMTDCAEFICT
jgi:hypothetical protein